MRQLCSEVHALPPSAVPMARALGSDREEDEFQDAVEEACVLAADGDGDASPSAVAPASPPGDWRTDAIAAADEAFELLLEAEAPHAYWTHAGTEQGVAVRTRRTHARVRARRGAAPWPRARGALCAKSAAATPHPSARNTPAPRRRR